MKRIIGAFIVVAAVVIFFSGAKTNSQGPGVPKLRRIDLSGLWVNDKGEQIIIDQTPYMVSGSFAKGGGDCPLAGPNRKRPLYISSVIQGRGLYEGGKLQGEMGGCTSKEFLIQDCHYDVAYIVRFTADHVSVNSISGTYTPDYVTYDEKNGHYTNCQLKKGGGTPQSFRLTRKCDPDKGSLCETLGNAVRGVKAAQGANASVALYQHLQMSLGDQIGKIRTNLCDDSAAQAKLDQIEDNLNSLSYSSGPSNLQNNLTLGYLEKGLRELIRMSCAVGPPVDYGECEAGSTATSDADKELLKLFQPTLVNMLRTAATNIVAYDQTKQCVAKMFASGCAPQPFTKALAAVSQAHQEGLPIGEGCDQACQSLGDWYEKQSCSKEGLPKTTVIAKCKLACVGLEWGQ